MGAVGPPVFVARASCRILPVYTLNQMIRLHTLQARATWILSFPSRPTGYRRLLPDLDAISPTAADQLPLTLIYTFCINDAYDR